MCIHSLFTFPFPFFSGHQEMDKIDYAMPREFYLDHTMSRATDTTCPKCGHNYIVKSHTHDELEQQLRTYLGCKSCHFRWVLGRKITYV